MARGVAFSGAVLAGLVAMPTTAFAEGLVRPFAHGRLSVDDDRLAGGGLGGVAAGYNIELDPLLVAPEVMLSFGGFGGDFAGFDARALAGVRVGLEAAVEPSLVVRGGYGHATVLAPRAGSGWNGGAIQVGIAVDDRLSRDLSVGGEITYDAFLFSDLGGVEVVHTVSAGVGISFWL